MIAPKEKVKEFAEISSISYDGLVESFELNNKKFVIGIKWHPELMLEDDFTKKLFKEFIEKCKQSFINFKKEISKIMDSLFKKQYIEILGGNGYG